MVFKRFVLFALSFQLAIGNVSHAQSTPSGQDPDVSEMGRELAAANAEMNQADRRRQMRLAQLSEEVARGQITLTPQERDPEMEIGQSVRVYNGKTGSESAIVGTYDPLIQRVEAPNLPYTGLKFLIEGESLVIQATRGADAMGNNGVVVAEQVRPNMHVAAVAQDGEFITLVMKDGSIRVAYMGQVASQLFSAPIAFYEVYTPAEALNYSEMTVRARYVTRGVSPEGLANVDPSVIIPTTPDNKPEITAGDVLVTGEKDGQSRILGIYAREVIYKRVEVRALMKAYMASLLQPDGEKMALMEGALDKKFAEIEKEGQAIDKGEITEIEREVLKTFSLDRIRNLVASSYDMKDFAKREFDKMTFEQWSRTFAELKANAATAGVDEKELEILERGWQKFVSQRKNNGDSQAEIDARNQGHQEKATTRMAKARMACLNALGRFATYAKNHIVTMGSLAGVATMLGSPYVIERLNIEALNKFYHNYFPSVVQDAAYRVPLALSTLSIIMFWPIGITVSLIAGQSLKVAAKMVDGRDSATARKIRDLNKNWNSDALSVWQRIHTAGFRLYAFLTLSIFTRVGQQILRQKSLVTALVNGLNPFTVVDPKSELGQRIGAQRSLSLGFNNPLPYPLQDGNVLREETEIRKRAQAVLVAQKNRAESRAWLAAAMAVSQETGIDLATLTMVAEKGLTPEIKDFLLSNGRNKRQWYVVADKVSRLMVETGQIGIDERTEINPKELIADYGMARDIAEQIKAHSQGQLNFEVMKISFRRFLKKSTANLFTFGLAQYNFLNNVYASQRVSEMTRHAFVIDYILTAGIPAFWGARANLARPEELVAVNNPSTLWTNRPHLMEMMIQVYLYFFVAGSRNAMVYQKVSMEPESIYRPLSETVNDPVDRPQKLGSATRSIIKNVFQFDESNVGAVTLKAQIRRFQTMQAGLVMDMMGRVLIVGQSWGAAFKGWAYGFSTGAWYIGIWWDFVQRGTTMTEDKIAERLAEFKTAQTEIERGLSRNDIAAVEKGYKDLLEIYGSQAKVTKMAVKNFVRNMKGEPSIAAGVPQPMDSMERLLWNTGNAPVVADHREALKRGESYWGLLAELQSALKAKDNDRIDMATEKIRMALTADPAMPKEEISRLNAQGLLEFSVQNPPVYTRMGKPATEMANLFGGVTTTILGLYMTVLSFRSLSWFAPINADGSVNWLMPFNDVGSAFLISHLILFPTWWLIASKAGRDLFREFKASPSAFWRARWYGKNHQEAMANEKREVRPGLKLPQIAALSARAVLTCSGAHLRFVGN